MKDRHLTVSVLLLVAMGATLLAAVAPSFIDAQVRNRLARVKADFAHLAAAIEAYYVDNNNYPNDTEFGWPWYPTYNLTTPVAYISPTLFFDAFPRPSPPGTPHPYWHMYRYINFIANSAQDPWKYLPNSPRPATWLFSPEELNRALTKYGLWRLSSRGPDGYASYDLTGDLDGTIADTGPGFPWATNCMVYDPTNGMISCGDIQRCQKTGEVTQMGGPGF